MTFEGLCGFVTRGTTHVEVYLLSGGNGEHGEHASHRGRADEPEHGAHLLMRTDFIDVPQTSWRPTKVGLIRDFDEATGKVILRQVALWSLRGMDATFADPEEAGQPGFINRNRMIDFKIEHEESSTLSKEEIRTNDPLVGVITLDGKKTKLDPEEPGPNDQFTLKKNNVEHKTSKFARLVHWNVKGEERPTITNSLEEAIILRDSITTYWATVCNVAPVPQDEGLLHFEHYYDGVKIKNDDFEMKIENAFADVYDCVPPTSWP